MSRRSQARTFAGPDCPDCSDRTGPATAETCLSPFVKRLDRPEKYLYLFCVDADARDNDFVAVIDVDPDSDDLRTITYTLDLGTQGERDPSLGLHRRPDADLGRRPAVEPDLDPRRGDRPGPAADREGARRTSRRDRPVGPAHYYALPGRMLISFLGAADGGLPAGMAEFTNDGKFIRRIDNPTMRLTATTWPIKPGLNRMVSSSFTPMRNYHKPLAEMDLKDFGREMVVWDFKNRKPLQIGKAGLAPLEVRWSLKPENNYGFTNCALDNSLWMFRGRRRGPTNSRRSPTPGPCRPTCGRAPTTATCS